MEFGHEVADFVKHEQAPNAIDRYIARGTRRRARPPQRAADPRPPLWSAARLGSDLRPPVRRVHTIGALPRSPRPPLWDAAAPVDEWPWLPSRGRFVFSAAAWPEPSRPEQRLVQASCAICPRCGPFRETAAGRLAIHRYIVGWPAGRNVRPPRPARSRCPPSIKLASRLRLHLTRCVRSRPTPRPLVPYRMRLQPLEAPRSSPRGASVFGGGQPPAR